ncbi:histone acetyltransferase type B catalytic subunit isoform X3 [Amborella trichopoda]|uniref:histone acetyltransferase type B catalytic subunit isoform X3 n=1 Tax=Amborella trichopoda TaxID=13333 RepID=UPI0009BE3D42|nr:histone acetyltransferase type B catalytic subunit isoform X3 [Amborella trichopoda]|eukprot:XP_020528794.1 histone acetyltransferase type B catalytic subunit isoform X3 [Amborella trichopoda]
MANKKKEEGASSEKKRRRVGFSIIDAGIEANECIKVFLVSSQGEMNGANGFCIEPIDLNQFAGKDGRIYGYKGLKIEVWLNCVSFQAYADIVYESSSDCGKGITDLNQILQSIFGESLIENKNDFLQMFSADNDLLSRHVVPLGEVVHCEASGEKTISFENHSEKGACSEEDQIVVMDMGSMHVKELYNHLVPFLLLLVEGSSPIDLDDPKWEMLLIVKKKVDGSGNTHHRLLGFATIYSFYHYPDTSRLRIGQVLVLPPYQGKGYGRHLLEAVNTIAVSRNMFDITIEEPSEHLQNIRDCMDTIRLLTFAPLKTILSSLFSRLKEERPQNSSIAFKYFPPKSLVGEVRKELKIYKKQFLQCWEVLLFLGFYKISASTEIFRAWLAAKVEAETFDRGEISAMKKCVIDVQNECGHDKTFVMVRFEGEVSPEIETGVLQKDESGERERKEEMEKFIEGRLKEIKAISEKVSLHCENLGIPISVA